MTRRVYASSSRGVAHVGRRALDSKKKTKKLVKSRFSFLSRVSAAEESPDDATGRGQEAPDYRRTHHSESESSDRCFKNPRVGPLSTLAAHHDGFNHAFLFSNVSPRCRRLPPRRQAPNPFRECPDENPHTTSRRALWPSFHPTI